MRLKQQFSTEGKLISALLISDMMHMGVQLGISPSVGLVKFELFGHGDSFLKVLSSE